MLVWIQGIIHLGRTIEGGGGKAKAYACVPGGRGWHNQVRT